MANQPWLETLRGELARRSLPPAYIERFVQELEDHLEDVMEDSMSTTDELGSRIGTPAGLAELAGAEYRSRRRWECRPWLAWVTFAVLPVPALLLFWTGAVALVMAGGEIGIGEVLRSASGEFTPTGAALIRGIVAVALLVPPAALALGFARLAQRTASRRRWTLVASAVLALVASLATHSVVLGSPGESTFTFGLSVGAWTLWQVLQAVAPLMVGLVAARPRFGVPAGC